MNKQSKSNHTLIENFGWIGVVLIIVSYGLIALGIVDSSSILYHSLILIGSIGVGVVSYIKHNYQPLVLNVIFAILAIIALARLLLF